MSKKWMAALAVPALAVTGVGVASAQTADEDPITDGSGVEQPAAEEHARHRGRGPGRGIGQLIDALGITGEELREAVEAGQTVADVAAELGIDIDQVIADLVAEAQTRADEAGHDDFDADALTERLTSAVNGEVDFSRRGPRGHHGRGGPGGASESIESLLGLDGEAIRTALQGGQTLAEVAEDQGVSLDELVSTIVDDIETRMAESDREVPEDFNIEDLTERVTERVTSEHPGRGGPGRRGPGGPGPGGPAPDAPVEGATAA